LYKAIIAGVSYKYVAIAAIPATTVILHRYFMSFIIKNIFLDKNINDKDVVREILEDIISKLQLDNYKNEQREISDQIKNVDEFYSFLFSLDYLQAVYELKLGEKSLNELSPGEKGTLLLVFYLMIDNEKIPLIIDQPEDNLDNKSVFQMLTKFIKLAKKQRQIIIVTHNPNLTVGADAEQVIYVEIDKSNNQNVVSVETGSIENQAINKRIVEILEGTMPAFDKRKLKYQ
jgi:predicted ATPase